MGSECERYWSLLFLLTGHPRRIADPTAYEFLRTPGVAWMNRVMTVSAIGLGLTQLRITFNFAYGLVFGRKAADNPWRANTPEWSTGSPLPHYNSDQLPTVYHPPYEYSVPGAEDGYLPQTRPRPVADDHGRSDGPDHGLTPSQQRFVRPPARGQGPIPQHRRLSLARTTTPFRPDR